MYLLMRRQGLGGNSSTGKKFDFQHLQILIRSKGLAGDKQQHGSFTHSLIALARFAGEPERQLVVSVVDADEGIGTMSKLPSHCRFMGRVLAMVLVASTFPSNLKVPMPEQPKPLKLLKARVPVALPWSLKSIAQDQKRE